MKKDALYLTLLAIGAPVLFGILDTTDASRSMTFAVGLLLGGLVAGAWALARILEGIEADR